jgi:O-antigen/teichoic acid export membrane protein
VAEHRKTPKGSKPASALVGGVWTMAERVTAQVSQLIVFIVAARMLGPAEFGIFALVSACAVLMLRVAEMGWAHFIMSWSGAPEVPGQVLFVAILSGLVFGALGGGVSLAVPMFGIEQRIGEVGLLFSLWLVLATASAAQKGIMIWQHRLRSSAIAESAGELAGLGVALWTLYHGAGIFALVYGRIAFQTVHLAISFSATRTLPRPGLPREVLKDLWVFSRQVFANRMIINLRLSAATFLIGGFLGPAAVGFYRAAERLVGALSEVVNVPTEVLAWSLFRQTRDAHGGSTAGFQARANQFFRLLFAVALPVFIWVSVLASDLITTLIGPEWLPALPVVAVLALSRALMAPGITTEAILSLAGEIRRLLPFTLLFFVLTLALTAIGAHLGLMAVAWAQVVVALVVMAGTVVMFRRHAAINWLECLAASKGVILPVLAGTLTLIALRDSAALAEAGPILRIVVSTLGTGTVYAVALLVALPDLRSRVSATLRREVPA